MFDPDAPCRSIKGWQRPEVSFTCEMCICASFAATQSEHGAMCQRVKQPFVAAASLPRTEQPENKWHLETTAIWTRGGGGDGGVCPIVPPSNRLTNGCNGYLPRFCPNWHLDRHLSPSTPTAVTSAGTRWTSNMGWRGFFSPSSSSSSISFFFFDKSGSQAQPSDTRWSQLCGAVTCFAYQIW